MRKFAASDFTLGKNQIPENGTYEDYYNQYMNRPVVKRGRAIARAALHAAPAVFGTGLGSLIGGTSGGFDFDKVTRRTKIGAGVGFGAGILASALLAKHIKDLTDTLGEDEAWRYAAMRSGKLDPSKTLV